MRFFACLLLTAAVTSAAAPRLVRVEPTAEGPRISIDVKRAPVRRLLAELGRVADVNMVLDEGIEGCVTARLERVRWHEAVAAVLRCAGLHGELEGRVATIHRLAAPAARR